MQNITVREWRKKYNAGEYAAKTFQTQCDAGWYDWFCKTSSLANRLEKFSKILSRVNNPFVLDNYRVWFKNNCPAIGPLYDDIRFEPIDETLRDTHYFGIAIDKIQSGVNKYAIFTARSGYNIECSFARINEVVKFLNEWHV